MSGPGASASLPTIAFGPASRVLPDLGRTASLGDLDFSQLRFSAPKDAEDRGDSKVCVSRAFLLPGKSSLKVRLTRATVSRVTHSRKDAHTVSVSIAQGGELQAFLLALDARALEVAQANVDAWFMSKMNADLVEEYYRGCSGAQFGQGSVGRFVIDGTPELPAAFSEPGAAADVLLQLVGLQFRPQYFTCVWKVVKATAAPEPEPEEEEEVGALRMKTNRFAFAFAESDDEEDGRGGGYESDDGISGGPTAEERLALRQELLAKLTSLESYERERIDALREMIAMLDAASIDDLGVIGEVDTRLEEYELGVGRGVR